MKVLITGANGLVGSRIVELLKEDIECIPFSSTECDITNEKDVHTTLTQTHFDVLLHLAGYTNVDLAEKERAQAYSVNVKGTQHLFDATQSKGKHMIYISTDFVFDGAHPPYFEESTPHPIGYYGQTKYEGEQVVKDFATIVRISNPYGPHTSPKPDFVQRIKLLLTQNKTLNMITDALITPTYIDDIAGGIHKLLTDKERHVPGIYHFVGSNSVSPFEAGRQIARHFNFSMDLLKPTTYNEFMKDRAQRPQYSEIKSKRNDFYPMKSFSEGLSLAT